ncbi:MAG TPA: ABC transporter permease [Nitrososphaerales archaeon]|nr:ABC transporter permease [Nitrososphaerales archaeon]
MVYLRDFLTFLGKRALGTVAIMLGVVIVIFLISHVLNPDPSALWAGAKARVSTVQQIRAEYHLGDPLYVQLYYFVVNTFTGNLGTDPVTGQSIAKEILLYAPNTIELVLAALIITVLIGVALGYISAMHFSSRVDSLIRVVYLTTWATPYYLGAIAAILVFSFAIPILPSGGMYDLSLTPPTTVTGIFVLDSLLSLNFSAFLSGLQHLILPAGVLALLDFGIVTRVTRSSILDVRWSTHVNSAKARGVPDSKANRRHILRNGLIDATTISAIVFGWMLSGTVIVEEIFAWPGIGQFSYTAIQNLDYPALVPVVVFFTFGVIIANFAADVIYSILDPRIALGGAKNQA